MKTMFHKIEIKARDPEKPISGFNCEILLDGIPLKGVKKLSFDLSIKSFGVLNLEMLSDFCIKGDVLTKIKEIKMNECSECARREKEERELVEQEKKVRKFEEYREAIGKDIDIMIEAGCLFRVKPNVQETSMYGPKFIVCINPEDVIPRAKACDIVTIGRFWEEWIAKSCADDINKKLTHNMRHGIVK